ncbi:Galactarate dehydratase (L-threo-forming) [Pseudomonas fluorescens]|uniref:Galactarate dehydratase n=2 Tax=Pseudomonas TaxID=286 RepID=A0A0A6D7W4_9PSED|nr:MULTISPECIES: altronate dehydratase family protein [Pseudomonas]KHA71853.1 galactarate dehydratase [Pseudomonas chlororaphis]MEB2652415.1 altronate dehydratase family protein [Pseudomonas siliginis]UST76361.1 altronate dehydratase family protein [Pseudomonas siliginis]UST92144.1 altronate dehydratase family protein [Pseudomonas siliginis]UVL96344.1 altronate dehydratase family protein [Pseudomonas siliginis]
MKSTSLALKLHPDDNVAIARASIPQGTVVTEFGNIVVLADVPAAHKIALAHVNPGDPVLRYGQIIGFATKSIEPGDYVHTHNLEMAAFERDYAFGEDAKVASPAASPVTFQGFVRADGRVATRNYIGVVSTVNCSSTVTKMVVEHFSRNGVLDAYPNVDGVVPITHSFGCCIEHNGEGVNQLRRTLGGFIKHANFAGVVVIGLGCEANQMGALFMAQGIETGKLIAPVVIQDVGGTRNAADAAIAAVESMLPVANECRREPVSARHLTVALQCGGSDGYSGITANPALGVAVDMLVAQGGTAILSETPEIYGAEHLLTRRAATREVGQGIVDLIKWWESYADREKGSIDNNPTPGNKAGGLTTILEKSLGAVAKSGSSALMGVYRYAEPITARGLVFMDAPGYDPMGATGQIASGANLVAFTTGRGSCFGAKPAPSIKLATNTKMYTRMKDDMDINCGDVMDGDATLESKGKEIFDMLIRVASGEKSKSEALGVGNEETVPWMIGAQM